jgi:Xaa-Pro aminopeptidase
MVCLGHDVYWLTGHWTQGSHHSAAVLLADGRVWLATPNQPARTAAADDIIGFEGSWFSTVRQEQPAVLAELARPLLAKAKAVGFDASPVASQIVGGDGRFRPMDPIFWELRRRKDPDELSLMRKAIACTEAMYGRARQVIRPGISEVQVFNELHAAAVENAGQPLSGLLGNDFACGARGGPARGGQTAQAGQIYILDLGPAYRGYFADNSRAFSVDRRPTEAQLAAWRTVVASFPIVERMARPGARCRDIFAAVDEHFRSSAGQGLAHHLGHGVGLQPHEYPHLNPRWDDVLIEGEVFTAEPGLYGPPINAGIRIENQYLVTAAGVENLVSFPMELA